MMPISEYIDGEQLISSAVQYLIEGGETEAAQLLLYCAVEIVDSVRENAYGARYGLIRGPRPGIDRLDDVHDVISGSVWNALTMVVPFNYFVYRWSRQATQFVPGPDWRRDLSEPIKGKGVANQASGSEMLLIWRGFRFRSATNIKVAAALDRAGGLFFPLSKARLSSSTGHRNVEPDFVVCHEGRSGILKVDGDYFQLAERSAFERDRDLLFKRNGLNCVERLDAERCYVQPDKTVEDFLLLMVESYRRQRHGQLAPSLRSQSERRNIGRIM